MKIKLFTVAVRTHGHEDQFLKLEKNVNDFIAANPHIHVVDLKLSSMASVLGQNTFFVLNAVLIYSEK